MTRLRCLRSIAILLTLANAGLMLGGCASPEPKPVSVAALMQHPAERSFVDGLRDYDNGAFEPAERDLHAALSAGLQNPQDVAIAHKYLAFIACAFNRIADCENNFRAAFAADPGFQLSNAEIGHPVWGPVYRRVAATEPAAAKSK